MNKFFDYILKIFGKFVCMLNITIKILYTTLQKSFIQHFYFKIYIIVSNLAHLLYYNEVY